MLDNDLYICLVNDIFLLGSVLGNSPLVAVSWKVYCGISVINQLSYFFVELKS